MSEEYPWSPEGMILLNTIESYIENNGGREILLQKVLRENKESEEFVCKESTNKRMAKIKELINLISRTEMAEILEVSEVFLDNLIDEMKDIGELPDDRKKRIRKEYYKILPVIRNKYQNRKFTEPELYYIKQHYATMTVKELAKKLGRTTASLIHGLSKIPDLGYKNNWKNKKAV